MSNHCFCGLLAVLLLVGYIEYVNILSILPKLTQKKTYKTVLNPKITRLILNTETCLSLTIQVLRLKSCAITTCY